MKKRTIAEIMAVLLVGSIFTGCGIIDATDIDEDLIEDI